MKRTAMELAALASAAMPGLDIVQAADSPDDPRAFDSAIVTDTDNNHWRVRSPRDSQAAFRLETEIQVLSGFTPAIRAHLPFRVPSVAGAVQIDGLRTFIYHQMPGQPVDLDGITRAEDRTIDDIGRILATIHKLPSSVVEAADLPAYGAEESRARLLSELDQMALTGKVPAVLLRRWENAFEERQMWTFIPRVVHGDFDETSLLIDRKRAVGVTAWTDLHIGDPAKDFMWLASTESIEFREAIISAYHQHMDVPADRLDLHLMRRAALAAEFSIAKYLMTGLHASDDTVVAEAQQMLTDLAADIGQTGGQDIGQQFWEPSATTETDTTDGPADDDAAVLRSDDTPVTADPVPSDDDSSNEALPDEAPSAVAQSDLAQSDIEAGLPDAPASPAADVQAEAASQDDESQPDSPDATDEDMAEAQLVVHTLTEDGHIVPEDTSQEPDEDTQPISWEVVNEQLRKD